MAPADVPRLSRIGGHPSLPDGIPWPEWKGKPQAFLCQVNLAEIPNECERDGLPSSGMLYFFYDQDQETWGTDLNDEGSWRVLFAAAPPANGAERSAPGGLDKNCIYAEKPVAFVPVSTYPYWDDERVEALNLSDKQKDQYYDLCDSVFKDGPEHHLFGYPSPVQSGDIELECQLVSLGLHLGDTYKCRHPRANEIEAGLHDWTLLLQLDSDEDANMMWGDAGKLYFCIRQQDLIERRFDKCWMILQCG